MSTIGEALAARDRRLFVGRERELALFRDWLDEAAEGPKLLSVTGPGGIGKSTLLRAFARECQESGRASVLVDGRVINPSPAGLAAALGGGSWRDAAERVSAARAVLLLDSFEDLRPITHFLVEEFLPSLASDVPVVVGSRADVTASWRPWRDLVRLVPLRRLSAAQARDFLRRRGLTTPEQIGRVTSLAAGHPLALSIAADIVVRSGSRTLPDTPEWRMAVHSLVQDLLRYTDDPGLQSLLEAAAIVRQFDESLLASIAPGDDVPGAFARLCALSVVRPGPRGLMLHDEVRGAIRGDLRWRNPERYHLLRRRALAHYRRLGHTADPEETAWMITEAGYLSEDPFVHLGMFATDDPSEVWTERARPADLDTLLTMQAAFKAALPGRRERPPAEELDPGLLARLLDRPEGRVQVSWSRTEGALGYGLALALTPGIVDLLPPGGAILQLAAAALGCGIAELPAALARADVWYLGTIATSDADTEPAVASLTREITRLFSVPRLLLACTADPLYRSVMRAFQFREILLRRPAGEDAGLVGLVLDLRPFGSEAFLDALVNGRRLPAVPPPGDVEAEVIAALEHWDDDRWLSASPLADFARFRAGEANGGTPGALRQMLAQALTTARAAAPGHAQAFRAIELAYIDGASTLEAAARRLAVSRPTFYRLRKRAVAAMTEAILSPQRGAAPVDPPRSPLYTRSERARTAGVCGLRERGRRERGR